ncbi:MAG: LysM peptidoglycan-binding domain-containing protein [Ignavibacteria bacterium]|nr:LysM peptidoglycan-binding domain-containing protein [Ignavibacteria bacterium]
MKLTKILLVLFAFSLFLGFSTSFAQDEEPWENIEEEEYLQMKADKEQTIANLQADINALDEEINNLNATLKDKNEKVKKAEDELATFGDQAAYKKEFEKVEKILNEKDKSGVKVEDAEKMLMDLEKSKLKCMGDYPARLAKMKKELDAWKNPPAPKTNDYTVLKGDCLWKISGKVYNEPKAWFAIWEKNRDGVKSAPPRVPKTIKNPNLIYPDQVLVIPPLNAADKQAAIEKMKQYKNKWYPKKRVIKKEATEEKKEDKKN